MTMTREEAINMIKVVRQYLTAGNRIFDAKKINETMRMAIEALQAKTDGDLISRADAIEAMGEEPPIWQDTAEEWAERAAWVLHVSALKALPSAVCDDCIWTVCNYNKVDWDTPSAEAVQGEWICKGDYAVCSKCGGSSGTQFDGVEPISKTTAFCPNCGARMKGGDDE